MLPEPFLSALGPDDHPYMLYAAILGIAALAVFVRSITGTLVDWRNLKKTDADGKDYVTREQLREVHGRVDTLISDTGKIRGEISTNLHQMREEITKELREVSGQMAGIQRSLGQIEGIEGRVDDHGAHLRQLQEAVQGINGRGGRPK